MAGGACAMPARFATLDRLAQFLLLIAAVTCIANGAFMLAKPLDWYVFVPTVVTTGPPNAHFIRDIGLAYLGSRSEEHTSELQSLMRISYAVFCLKNKKTKKNSNITHTITTQRQNM